MANVVLFGLRDFASLAHFYLKYDSPHEVVAFTVDREFVPADPTFEGLPVVPFDELESRYPPSEFAGFAPLSHQGMNRVRQGVYERFKAEGLSAHQLRQLARHVLPRHADRRQLFSPRRQHDSAIRDDRKQRRACGAETTSDITARSAIMFSSRRTSSCRDIAPWRSPVSSASMRRCATDCASRREHSSEWARPSPAIPSPGRFTKGRRPDGGSLQPRY